MSLIIKNGTLVTAAETFLADLLIENGKIAAIGKGFAGIDAKVVDAAGKLVLPGGVDPHTHFELPMGATVSSDDHYTGHKAAAFGGTTTAIDFINQDYPTLHECVAAWHKKADHKAAIDYSFHMNLTHFDEKIAAEIGSLRELGINSIKVFMAYNGRLRLLDGEIFQAMRIAQDNNLLTMLHAEDGDVIDILIAEALAAGNTSPVWHARTRPSWGAAGAVMRGAALTAQTEAPLYVVHMNAGAELDMLDYARSLGLPVMGETCPQYLFFNEEHLQRPDGSKWVCSPPMRSVEDNEQLWQGVMEGKFQVIATDHCPFFYDGAKPILYEGQPVTIPGKELGAGDFTKIPNGLPMVGDRMPVLWTYGVGAGRITPNQFVALTSTNPARIFGLYPRKGTLAPGADADVVIWDPERRLTYGVAHAQHRTDYNLFEGWELTGYPEQVYLRGELIVDHEQWLGRPGMGEYLFRGDPEVL